MRRRKLLKLNNKGVTLVELIVSLLILVIVFAPLMTSFVTALKANKTAKELTHGETVAQNIMEQVKFLKYKGASADGSGFTKHTDELTGAVADYTLEKNNIHEGDGYYDVQVVFDPNDTGIRTEYKPDDGSEATMIDVNEYEFADMSELSKSTTTLINPQASSKLYDEHALNYFKEKHEAYYNDLDTADYNTQYAAYLDLWDVYNQELDKYNDGLRPDLPTPPGEFVPPETRTRVDASILRNYISKCLILSVKRHVSVGDAYYTIDSYLQYTFDNTEKYLDPAPEKSSGLVRDFIGFCDAVELDDVKTIYLMYDPINDVVAGKLNVSAREKVQISSDNLTEPIDVYVVVQAPETVTITGKLDVDNSSTDIKLHSQAELNAVYESGLLKKDNDQKVKRIYSVTVNVYNHGTNELVASLKSTVAE